MTVNLSLVVNPASVVIDPTAYKVEFNEVVPVTVKVEFNKVVPVTDKLFYIVVSVSLIVIRSILVVNNLMFAASFAIIEKS